MVTQRNIKMGPIKYFIHAADEALKIPSPGLSIPNLNFICHTMLQQGQ
jgi:hypothetical protein